jgi:cation:H+ antiporter
MLISSGWIALGLALTFIGAEALVRAAASLAARLGVPPLIVGLTIVAWGTSAPELVVSSMAALNGQGGIALGNVVGSNIFNIAAIVGIAALICPLRVHSQIVRLDIPIMIAASVLLLGLVLDRHIARLDAVLLLAGMVAYTTWTFVQGAKPVPEPIETEFKSGNPVVHRHVAIDIAVLMFGLGALVFGSRALVTGAVSIARSINVSETLIGLTIVAAGTSLPELATSIVAAWRRQTDIAIGNVVGSNFFNILGIVGLAGLVSPLDAPELSLIDLSALMLCALLFFPLAKTGFVVSRPEGAILLLIYAGYLGTKWYLIVG